MPSLITSFAGLLFALLLYPTTAHAYLDPGAGSILLQVLLAGIAGLSVVIKIYWRRFALFFSGLFLRFSKKDPQQDQDDEKR